MLITATPDLVESSCITHPLDQLTCEEIRASAEALKAYLLAYGEGQPQFNNITLHVRDWLLI